MKLSTLQSKLKRIKQIESNGEIMPEFTEFVYLAGPWFTEKGKMIYDTVLEIIEKNKLPNQKFYIPREHTYILPSQTFEANVANIHKAKTVIALIDEKDTGTAWEIGMAYNSDKNLILVGVDADSFKSGTNIMLAMCAECITLDQLANLIQHKDYKKHEVPDNWEGLQ